MNPATTLKGAVLLLVVTLGYSAGGIGPMSFISGGTCGLMLMYTPTGSFLYDRLLAATRTEGTVRVFDRNLYSRIPLVSTHARLNRACANRSCV
jgi:hypothetical protein